MISKTKLEKHYWKSHWTYSLCTYRWWVYFKTRMTDTPTKPSSKLNTLSSSGYAIFFLKNHPCCSILKVLKHPTIIKAAHVWTNVYHDILAFKNHRQDSKVLSITYFCLHKNNLAWATAPFSSKPWNDSEFPLLSNHIPSLLIGKPVQILNILESFIWGHCCSVSYL